MGTRATVWSGNKKEPEEKMEWPDIANSQKGERRKSQTRSPRQLGGGREKKEVGSKNFLEVKNIHGIAR